MCFLELPEASGLMDEPFADQPEFITRYQNSQGHDFAAVVTNKQSIYVYSLAEMRTKFFNKQRKLER